MVGSPIGSAIGFPLTIWLSSTYGWRASFYMLGALSLLVVMPAILGIVKDHPPTARAGEPAAAQAGAAVKPKPEFGLVFRNYRFWLVTAYGCGLLMYLWGLNSWLPSYLERSRHFNLRQMGIFSSLPFICMFVGELSAGIISDRTGRRALLCFIGLFGAGVLMYIGTIIADPHLAAVVIALSAGCWGLGLPTQYALAMDIIPASTLAAGIGALNGISNLVGACAPVLIGWIIGRTGNFNTGLMVIVLAAMLGACLILPLVRRH
jgi:sugar phosphate permease